MGILRKHYGCPGSPGSPFFNKTGEEVASKLAQASSARPGELGCFHIKQENAQKPLEWPRFENYFLHPPILLNTPPFPIFCWFFFCNVTELHELRKDTCFLSVMSQNFHITQPSPFFLLPECYGTSQIVQRCFLLIFGMSRNSTNCVTMLSFDFRHVTKLHESPNDGCQVPRSGQTKVACHQTMIPERN